MNGSKALEADCEDCEYCIQMQKTRKVLKEANAHAKGHGHTVTVDEVEKEDKDKMHQFLFDVGEGEDKP